MKDLFETFTQARTTRSKVRRSRESTQLEALALVDALGGESNSNSSRWMDLDHALASGSGVESVSEELNFDPGPLESELEGEESV